LGGFINCRTGEWLRLWRSRRFSRQYKVEALTNTLHSAAV